MADETAAYGAGDERLLTDRLLIRELPEKWVLWRDAGDWERLRTLCHDGARVQATWTEGTIEAFIDASIAGGNKGVDLLHSVGGSTADIAGDRAIAQTKMQICQRAEVDGVLCDVQCWVRIYDFIERRQGRWGFVFREPVYERDRIDPVDPSRSLKLDPELLASFPEGYRHLGYLQTRIGYPVRRDLPGPVGEGIERLRARAAAWLAGGDGVA